MVMEGEGFLQSMRDRTAKTTASAVRFPAIPNRFTVALLALLLSLSVSLLAIPTQARGPDGYNWIERAGNPVFTGTERAYYPRVIKVGATYHMWYTDTAGGLYQVRHTTSTDGLAWSAPTVTTGLTGQPAHTVVVNVGTDASPSYRMWYGDGATWPAGSSCLRTAESSDGLTWTNDQAIGEDPNAGLLKTDNVSDPAYAWRYGTYGPGAVLYNPLGSGSLNTSDPMGNKYVMYYDQYTRYWLTGVQEAAGLAISVDGKTWSRYGNAPVLNASGGTMTWDGQYVYAWSVVKDASDYHMWYSGGIAGGNEGIGYAYSTDGLNWTKDPLSILHRNDPSVPAWRNIRTYTPCVLQEGSIYKMWYSGLGGGVYGVGYATARQPGGNPADPGGAVKRAFFRRDSVYCSGSFFLPRSNVDVYIVVDDSWSNNMPIPADLSSDGFNTVPIDGVGNLAVTMIWPARLTIGQYDIVFDTNQDGIYQSGVDVVDDPGDPGFEVFDDPPGSGGSAPVFPNIYIGIAAALGAGALAYLVRATIAKKAPPLS
jgi:hypothetical protein